MERPAGRRLVDLTHVITAGMVTYPGLPGPEIGEHLTRAPAPAGRTAGDRRRLHAAPPPPVAGLGTFPVRAYAVVEAAAATSPRISSPESAS